MGKDQLRSGVDLRVGDLRTHIAIIDPAVKKPEITAFNLMSRMSGCPLTYHLPALLGMESLESEKSFAGIVVLGSLASVHDRYPWLEHLGLWLVPLMKTGTPTLGICFGHQLIAKLLGGNVDFAKPDHKKHQGSRLVSLQANPLWGNKPLQGTLCVSHEETVTEVPNCMDVVGLSDEIPTDVLAHKTLPIWTFQSHPEATTGFLEKRNTVKISDDPYSFGNSLVKRFLDFALIVR